MKKILTSFLSVLSIVVFAQDIDPDKFFNDLEYRNVGPARGGRVTAVAGIESRPNEYYMGATGGGGRSGGNGGSGIVILRIPEFFTASFSAGLSVTSSTITGYKIYSVTGGTGSVSFDI